MFQFFSIMLWIVVIRENKILYYTKDIVTLKTILQY